MLRDPGAGSPRAAFGLGLVLAAGGVGAVLGNGMSQRLGRGGVGRVMVGGLLAQHLGYRPALWAGVAGMACSGVVAALSSLRRARVTEGPQVAEGSQVTEAPQGPDTSETPEATANPPPWASAHSASGGFPRPNLPGFS